MTLLNFTVLGAPRTKANSPRIAKTKTGRRFVLPSKASEQWETLAILQIRSQFHANYRGKTFHEGQRWNCEARIYRDRNVGDASNFYKAIGDALERAGAVANDRYIVSWNGSELLIDRANPRVSIVLTEVA